jgi:hypothetical protein
VTGIGRDHRSLQRKEFHLSQYQFPPPPYSPPMVDPRSWAMAQPHAAGRAAALWQLILGALLFLSGSCVVTAVAVVPDEVMNKAIEQQHTVLPPFGNMSPAQELRLGMSIISGVMIVAGGVLLLLAFFVRRGGRISTVFSIVFTSVISLILLINFVSGLLQLAGNPQVILPLALFAGILALCAITIAKLVAALKSSGSAQMQAMQQAYYWMMQHHQAGTYGQGGYGAIPGQIPGRDAPAPPIAPPPPPPNDRI